MQCGTGARGLLAAHIFHRESCRNGAGPCWWITLTSSWPYSSIHRYIEAGMMDHGWGGGIIGNDESGYGERG
jgi:hypothetical protein